MTGTTFLNFPSAVVLPDALFLTTAPGKFKKNLKHNNFDLKDIYLYKLEL